MGANESPERIDAMIALLPTTSDWCKQNLPHMTLVYAGLIEDLGPTAFNEMAKDAATIAMLSSTLTVPVMGPDVFGDEEKVNVLKLQPSSALMSMRRIVDRWDASEHPFRPHVTVGAYMSGIDVVPSSITFDRIYVSFGDDNLTFWLKKY